MVLTWYTCRCIVFLLLVKKGHITQQIFNVENTKVIEYWTLLTKMTYVSNLSAFSNQNSGNNRMLKQGRILP